MAASTPVRAGGAGLEPSRSVFSYAGLVEYLVGVREELKKASWPDRAELFQLTKVVLVIIFLVAVYCGILDSILTVVANFAFNHK